MNYLKIGKRQLSITKEKANEKSKPKIMSTNVDHLRIVVNSWLVKAVIFLCTKCNAW